jgi:truncated hemoglobin YjbI
VKRSYHGDMLAAHQKLGKLPRSLFPRWLALFYEAVDGFFIGAPAAIIRDDALKTAHNLERSLIHSGANSAPRVHSDGFDLAAQSTR